MPNKNVYDGMLLMVPQVLSTSYHIFKRMMRSTLLIYPRSIILTLITGDVIYKNITNLSSSSFTQCRSSNQPFIGSASFVISCSQ